MEFIGRKIVFSVQTDRYMIAIKRGISDNAEEQFVSPFFGQSPFAARSCLFHFAAMPKGALTDCATNAFAAAATGQQIMPTPEYSNLFKNC